MKARIGLYTFLSLSIICAVIFFLNSNLIYLICSIAFFLFFFTILTYGVFVPSSAIFIDVIYRIPQKAKTVYLTFDDGPDETVTPLILDLLYKHNIKAVFFVIAEKAKKYNYIIKRALNEGHKIGNHSLYHSRFFPFFLYKRLKADLKKSQEILNEIAEGHCVYFRPPMGIKNPSMRRVMKDLNLKCVTWDTRGFDTTGMDPALIISKITDNIQNGSIILFHDGSDRQDILDIDKKIYILTKIIKTIRTKGYNFSLL